MQYPQGPYGYGPPPKRGMSSLAVTGIVIACLFGGCVFLGAIGAAAKKTPAASASTANATAPAAAQPKEAPPQEEEKPTPVGVPASTLIADYKGNEVRGDAKWKGKYVEIDGIVDDVKKDFTGSIYILLGTGAPFEHAVRISLAPQYATRAASLEKGMRIKARGTVKGMILVSVMVDDGEI